MLYKKRPGDNSRMIQIDECHSCSEEQLRSFLSYVFKNRDNMKANYEALRTYRPYTTIAKKPEEEIKIFSNFDSVIYEAYESKKHYLVDDYLLNVSQFMNDTLSE